MSIFLKSFALRCSVANFPDPCTQAKLHDESILSDAHAITIAMAKLAFFIVFFI
jgi:hypothetical protein